MTTTSLKLLAAGIVGLLLSWSPTSRAGYYNCCGNPIKWPNSSITMGYCTASFSSAFATRITQAAQAWNDLGDSSLNFSITADSNCTFTPGTRDNANEIWYNSGSGGGPLALQTSFKYYEGGGGDGCSGGPPCCSGCTAPHLAEVDIVAWGQNAAGAISWTSSMPQGALVPSAIPNYFVVAVQHELGHALGLTHSSNGMARMSSFEPTGGWFFDGSQTVTPLGDDAWGARQLYPFAPGYFSKVYAANRASGPVGESFPVSYNPNVPDDVFYYPARVPPLIGQDINFARAGDSIEARYCFGNLGPSPSSSTALKIYLSDDLTFGSDTLVWNGTLTVGAHASWCTELTFTIPSNATPGIKAIYYTVGDGSLNYRRARQNRGVQVIP